MKSDKDITYHGPILAALALQRRVKSTKSLPITKITWCCEVYGLFDPDTNELMYVGSAKKSKRRLSSHITASKKPKYPVQRWINNLLLENKKPIMRTLEHCDSSNRWNKEAYWIDKMRKAGFAKLNAT